MKGRILQDGEVKKQVERNLESIIYIIPSKRITMKRRTIADRINRKEGKKGIFRGPIEKINKRTSLGTGV